MNYFDKLLILQYTKQPNVLLRLNFLKISGEIAEIKILMRLQGFVVNCGTAFRVGTFAKRSKVEEILKGSLDSIPSSSTSVKIQIWAGKFA